MAITMSVADAIQVLEGLVIHPGMDPSTPVSIMPEHVELSKAVSLKRIADALTGTAVEELVRDLHGPLTNLAWELGRSFQAGTRTDR